MRKFYYNFLRYLKDNFKNVYNNFSIIRCFTVLSLGILILRNYLKDDCKASVSEKIYDIEKNSYYEGISYHTKTFCEEIHHFDIRSSDSYSMTFPMPHCFEDLKEWDGNEIKPTNLYECIFQYNDKVHCCMTPVLKNGQLHYPLFIEKSWRWGSEIIFLKEKGKIKLDSLKIFRVVEYTENNVFSKFITEIHKKIKSATNPIRKMLKLILNNTFRKFGKQKKCNRIRLMKLSDFGIEIIRKDIVIRSIEAIKGIYNDLKGDSIVLVEYYENNLDISVVGQIGSMVRYASYITALTRINLFEKVYRTDDKKIIYIDTDSVFSTVDISDREIVGTELGKWRKKGIMKDVFMFGPKIYF